MSFNNRLSSVTAQRELSQVAWLQRQAAIVISKYERGETIPSIEINARIAEALKVPLDHLVFGISALGFNRDLLEKTLIVRRLDEGTEQQHLLSE